MKALNYLQYSNLFVPDKYLFKDFLKHAFGFNGHTFEFFTQPFKPEMVEQYFEGWRQLRTNDKFRLEFVSDKSHFIELWSEAEFRTTGYVMPYPKTLDEFITLFQLSNIELEFKEIKG